jgi:porphobilinogen deaminase
VDDRVEMEAIVLDATGEKSVRSKESGPADQPDYVGACLAERLLYEGGAELLPL